MYLNENQWIMTILWFSLRNSLVIPQKIHHFKRPLVYKSSNFPSPDKLTVLVF